MKHQKLEQQKIIFLSDNAIKIQKTFRGFYSRKYIHDFFKRKRQIIEMDNYVKEQREYMLLGLAEKENKQLLHNKKLKDKKIHDVAKNLHHLVSTKAQRGVYNYKIENIIKEQVTNS
ncbi:calmodulin binding protein [Plasmodium malariae]|uniref:Calmodulin binding protein n=2 Tax=Plasmodium (Plasmodium) TaxID=418103 RepID=A0A1A8W0R5_PLAMA|nr:calmodulin binding protein [Plasmodium malariae]